MEKNSDDSKQQCFSSNTMMGILRCEARLEMLQNDTRGFPSCEQKKHPYQKHVEGSRKLRTRDNTQKNDSFAINLLPPKKLF